MKVKTESIYETETPKWAIARPIYEAFRKIQNYTSPLLNVELIRKRRKVKKVEE